MCPRPPIKPKEQILVGLRLSWASGGDPRGHIHRTGTPTRAGALGPWLWFHRSLRGRGQCLYFTGQKLVGCGEQPSSGVPKPREAQASRVQGRELLLTRGHHVALCGAERTGRSLLKQRKRGSGRQGPHLGSGQLGLSCRKGHWTQAGGSSKTCCPCPSSTRRRRSWGWPRSTTGRMGSPSTSRMRCSWR